MGKNKGEICMEHPATSTARAVEWQTDALCAQTDPEAFFPDKGGSTLNAKKICDSCDVTEDCLEYALENNEKGGIWGGLAERERQALRRQRLAEGTLRRVS